MTYGQMELLYEFAIKREVERREFEAAIHGAEMKKTVRKETTTSAPVKKSNNIFMFGDPEEYKDMSEEEKKELTRKMMGMHKHWAASKPLGGKTSNTPKFMSR